MTDPTDEQTDAEPAMAERRTEALAAPSDGEDEPTGDLPADAVEEAERLTRLARNAIDDAEADAYRRERADLLADHDYTARIRDDDTRDVLVLHPEEWLEEGVVQVDRIDDLDRGVELPLSGPGQGDDWEEVYDHNRDIVARVADDHGEAHGANAEAFAEFMSNHYAKALERATAEEREQFLSEYYPRNVWPTSKQRDVVEESVEIAIETGESITGSPR